MRYKMMLYFVLLSYSAFSQGVRFEHIASWSETKQKAKIEDKYIFVEIMATWCGPCKQMERETFSNQELGDAFDKKFVSIRIQADRTEKDSEQVRRWYQDALGFIESYRISGFPCLLFFDPDGALIHRVDGARDVAGMFIEMNKALHARSDENRMVNEYENGNRDPKFIGDLFLKTWSVGNNRMVAQRIANNFISSLRNDQLFEPNYIEVVNEMSYISNLKNGGFLFTALESKFHDRLRNYHQTSTSIKEQRELAWLSKMVNEPETALVIANRLIDNLPVDSIYTKANLNFIQEFTSRSSQVGYRIFNNNRRKVNKIMGDHFAERKLCWIIYDENVSEALRAVPVDWDAINLNLERFGDLGEEEFLRSRLYYYFKDDKRLDEAIPAAIAYLDRYLKFEVNARSLNNFAWAIFQKREGKLELKHALRWSKRAIKLQPIANWMDTYANLLYKLGRRKRAIKVEKRALSLDPKDMSIINNLEKMKHHERTW